MRARTSRAWVTMALATMLVGCALRGPTAGGPPRPDATSPAGPAPRQVDLLTCVDALAQDPGTPHWLVRAVGATEQATLEADGTVVAVTRTDIHATVDDYRTWQVSPQAVERVAALLSAHDGVRPPAGADAGGFVDVLTPCVTTAPPGAAAVLDLVLDPQARRSAPVRWRPDRLWLVVHPPDRLGTPNEPTDPFGAWPLPGRIADHVVGEDLYRPDADEPVPVRWVCLHSDDVTPIWALQQPGTRRTWIRLEDADGQWEVSIVPNWPGYALSEDPCA